MARSQKHAIALVLLSAALLVAAGMAGAAWAADRLPSWVVLESSQARLDGGRQAQLHDGSVSVVDASGATSARSPDEWRVQAMLSLDVNCDGARELVLLSWRRGSYGSDRPFWASQSDNDWTQHVFIVQPGNGALRPLWMSSALGMEVTGVEDTGGGRMRLAHRDGTHTVWEWGTWGLGLVDEQSEDREQSEARDNEDGTYPAADDLAPNQASVVVTGDIIVHESMYEQAWDPSSQTFDFAPLFAPLRAYLLSQDLAIACQETAFVHDPADRSGFPTFGTPEALGHALADAGYDVVCTATNHAADKGTLGLHDTLAFWGEHYPDVSVLGMHEDAREPAVSLVKVHGMTIALLNATEHLNGRTLPDDCTYRIDTLGDLNSLLREVGDAAQRADLVLCVLHTGDEYANEPSAYQREVVQAFADAGASAVVCTHTHVVQPTEEIRTASGGSCVVFWGLGNLVSHQTDPRTIEGGIARLVVQRDDDGAARVASFELVPTICHIEPGKTAAYLREDYPSELARRHLILGSR